MQDKARASHCSRAEHSLLPQLWYLYSDTELHTQRVVAGTNLKVEAGPPTDSNEQWQLVLPDSDLEDWQALRVVPQS